MYITRFIKSLNSALLLHPLKPLPKSRIIIASVRTSISLTQPKHHRRLAGPTHNRPNLTGAIYFTRGFVSLVANDEIFSESDSFAGTSAALILGDGIRIDEFP